MYGSNSSIKYTDWTDEKGNAESVARYGGFYVARYEAGVPETANFYASKEGTHIVQIKILPNINL